MRRQRLAPLVAAGVLASAPVARGEEGPACAEVLTAATVKRLFDGVAALKEAGCQLQGAAATPTRLVLQWSVAGRSLSMVVQPRACAPGEAVLHGRYGLIAPPALERLCPATVTGLGHLLAADTAADLQSGAPPQASWTARWPWPLLLGLLLAALALGLGPRRPFGESRRPAGLDLGAAALLFASALLLRLLLGPWGPHHINGQGPIWIGGALDPSLLRYGPGYPELFGTLARIGGAAPDHAIFAANAAISALAPALLFGLGRILGLDRRRGLVAGLALAFDPVSIRGAATEAYFPSIIALTLAAALVLAVAATVSTPAAGWRRFALGMGAALLGLQAARIHPVAWAPVALVPLVLLGAPGLPLRRRLQAVAAASLGFGLLAALAYGPTVMALLGEVNRHRPGSWSGIPAPWLGVLFGVALGTFRHPVARPAWGQLALLLVTRSTYGQGFWWQASYDRLFLPIPLLALVACLPHRHRLAPVAQGLAVGVLGLVLGAAAPSLRRSNTEQLEYRWTARQIAAMPDACAISYVERVERKVVALPDYLAPGARAGRAVRVPPAAIPAILAGSGCVYYVHTSLCSTAPGGPACAAVERGLDLEPLAQARFPALPTDEASAYTGALVEVRWSRVRGVVAAPGR